MITVMSKVNEKNEMREEVARDYASLLIGKRMRSLSPHYFIIFIKDLCSSDFHIKRQYVLDLDFQIKKKTWTFCSELAWVQKKAVMS